MSIDLAKIQTIEDINNTDWKSHLMRPNEDKSWIDLGLRVADKDLRRVSKLSQDPSSKYEFCHNMGELFYREKEQGIFELI